MELKAVKRSVCLRRPDAERAREVQRRLKALHLPTLHNLRGKFERLREDTGVGIERQWGGGEGSVEPPAGR
jgi:hypothetical protein